ncbi:MAG: chemotaxis-specific protein-glutamate methyltransferase CheB [Caldilineaceae bacterium]|nr:chemotaxis-specific protein-glutamate methyltransferase CheB [Caldilineaceae bacterium]
MFKVLVVEDSAVMREYLVAILASDPALQVIGTANNGEEAVEAAKRLQPDVITMDIDMPKLDGFEATRQIMETAPRPIVIVTGSWDPKEVVTSFRAMEAGAVAVVAKPAGIGHPDHAAQAQKLIQAVKTMAEVRVVRRWARPHSAAHATEEATASFVEPKRRISSIKLVAIGASTGGPMALRSLLAALPRPFAAPVVVVQHMAAGFIAGFVEWLAQTTGLPIHVATDGENLLPGHVYVAPDGFQMKMKSWGKIALTQDPAEHGLSPSVSYLFRSVAEVYGSSAAGVLLTGMGRDGAAELKRMRDRGAMTFVQDKESSAIHGMPGEAIRLEAATYVLAPERIASALVTLMNQSEMKQSEINQSDQALGTMLGRQNDGPTE